MNVEPIRAVYVKLENRPGSLERAARALGERRINIEAIGLETDGPHGFARVVTARAKEAVDALHAQGVEAYESEGLLVSVPNRPGELARVAAEVAAAGINVEGLVTTTDGRLVVRTSDNERATQILKKL